MQTSRSESVPRALPSKLTEHIQRNIVPLGVGLLALWLLLTGIYGTYLVATQYLAWREQMTAASPGVTQEPRGTQGPAEPGATLPAVVAAPPLAPVTPSAPIVSAPVAPSAATATAPPHPGAVLPETAVLPQPVVTTPAPAAMPPAATSAPATSAPSLAMTMAPPAAVRGVSRRALPLTRSQTLDQAISRLECGWARLRTVGKRQLLEGVAGGESVADLLLTRDELPAARQPELRLQLFTYEPSYCRALELVQRFQQKATPAAARFSLALRLPPGDKTLGPDKAVQFDVTPPTFAGFLRVDLLTRTGDNDAAGRVVVQHLIPRTDPSTPGLNHPVVLFASPEDFVIPRAGPGFQGWTTYLPDDIAAGADLVVATWSGHNDQLDQPQDDETDVEGYLLRLTQALDRQSETSPVAVTAVLIPIVRTGGGK